jgi:hypothetical protein
VSVRSHFIQIGTPDRPAILSSFDGLADGSLTRPSAIVQHRDGRVDNLGQPGRRPTPKTFFGAQPVDDIFAGHMRSGEIARCDFHSPVPSYRTRGAACLHKLSTALCTGRLDV